MRYFQDIQPISKTDASKIFSSGNSEEICNALVAIAFYENDWRWAQNMCLELLENNDVGIRGLSATCLGHIARIHEKIDVDKVVNALRNHLTNSEIKGQVEDALDDINTFVFSK